MAGHRVPYVQPGQPVSAAAYNRLVDAINAVTLTTNSGGGASVFKGANGPQVVVPVGAKLTLFALTATLSASGSAAAVFCSYDGSAVTELTPTLTVYDVLGDSEGSDGDIGIAWLEETSGKWIVLRMACI